MLQNLLIGNGLKEEIIFKDPDHDIFRGQFLADIDILIARLSARKCHRWALCYQNSYLFTVALFAVLCSKGQPVLLPNNQLGTIELFRGEFDEILSDLPSLNQFVDSDANIVETPRNLECDSGIVFFTSGSTGQAKKVVRSLEQTIQEIEVLEDVFGEIVANSSVYTTVSHQHIYGLIFYILWSLYAGRVIHIPKLNWIESVERIITQDTNPVILISSPSLLMRMPEIKITNKRVTIFSSGGRLTTTAISGCNIIDVLGSTETGGVAFKNYFDYNWKPLPRVAVQLDETGCLKVSSPFCGCDDFVMGDKAQINHDGSFRLLERADRIVKIEGKRVSLIEVENVLKQHEFVSEAYAISMENKRQYIAVVIVLSAEGRICLKNKEKRFVNSELKKLLARYFEPVVLPKQFRYLDAIPVNDQGKYVVAEIMKIFEKKYPEIIDQTQNEQTCITLHLFISADIVFFQGHFPEAPILPGMVQVDWAIFFAHKFFNVVPEIFLNIEQLKFMQVIKPNYTLFLSLKLADNILSFKYFNDDVVYSMGKIKA